MPDYNLTDGKTTIVDKEGNRAPLDIGGMRQEISNIAYSLPQSNGVDDTAMFEEAIGEYDTIKLIDNYIISSITLSDGVTIIGDKNKEYTIHQLLGSSDHMFTIASGARLILKDVILSGNSTDAYNCLNFTTSATYDGTGYIENVVIKNFNGTGILLEENRNLLSIYGKSSILNCVDGIDISSSDNRFSSCDFGDSNKNIILQSGGGNAFVNCNIYRSEEASIELLNECYYSSFVGCSIDSNNKDGVIISQSGVSDVTERQHKFVSCSFFGNSALGDDTYSDFNISGVKGLVVSDCNFFTYNDAIRPKHIINTSGTCSVNFVGNSYDTTTTPPYATAITNNIGTMSIFDKEAVNILSDITLRGVKYNSPATSGALVEQTLVRGEGYARKQTYADGRVFIGDGASAPLTAFKKYNSVDYGMEVGKYIMENGFGVGHSLAGSSLGSVSRKIEVFDVTGNSLGFIAVYDTIS